MVRRVRSSRETPFRVMNQGMYSVYNDYEVRVVVHTMRVAISIYLLSPMYLISDTKLNVCLERLFFDFIEFYCNASKGKLLHQLRQTRFYKIDLSLFNTTIKNDKSKLSLIDSIS